MEQDINKRVYDQLLESFKRPPPEYSKRENTQERKNDFQFLESRCSFTINAFEFIIQSLLKEREETSKLNQILNDLANNNQNDPESIVKLLTNKNKSLENDLNNELSRTDDLNRRFNELLSHKHGLFFISFISFIINNFYLFIFVFNLFFWKEISLN